MSHVTRTQMLNALLDAKTMVLGSGHDGRHIVCMRLISFVLSERKE